MATWTKATEYKIKHWENVYASLIEGEGIKYNSFKCSGYFHSAGFFIWNYAGIRSILPDEFDRLMILDESEPSFSIEDMRQCWEKAQDSCILNSYPSYGVLMHDFKKITEYKIEYFKHTFNIDIKE